MHTDSPGADLIPRVDRSFSGDGDHFREARIDDERVSLGVRGHRTTLGVHCSVRDQIDVTQIMLADQ